MEYSIYPFEYIRITQRHDEGNHKAHNIPFKDYSDKPWDEACKDSGRSYFVPQNDYIVEEILGLNTTVTTNSVRLKSVNKLKIPYQEEPTYLYLTLTHMNEEDIKKIHVGEVLKKNTKILLEGKDGATAYHFHVTANIGKYYGFKKNSNGKWCFVYEKSLTPPEGFYIDKKFNKILNANGYNFKEVPTFFPPKGYFTKGDSGENVEKICTFFSNKVKGNYYGDYLEACVKVFQKLNNLEQDGSIGNITLSKMKEEGFKE